MTWVKVPDDYVPKVGDILRSIIRYENTGVLPADDKKIIDKIVKISNKEIEDEVYKQTGVKIKVRNKKVEVVESGWSWDVTLEYEVTEAQTPGILAVAIAIAVTVGSIIALLITVNWFLKSNEKYIEPVVESPLSRNLLLGLLFVLGLYLLIKSVKK